MDIERITIIGGCGKSGDREPVGEVFFEMGSVISIVGPRLRQDRPYNDIGLFADRNTPTGRQVLINGLVPSDETIDDPSRNPITMITQHTNFLSDLSVRDFLFVHSRIRKRARGESPLLEETLDFANRLAGEPVIEGRAMTELSGGQATGPL